MRSEYSGEAEWGVHFTPDMSFIILAEPAKPGQGFSFSFIVKQLATEKLSSETALSMLPPSPPAFLLYSWRWVSGDVERLCQC